jgi:hypothetical protein
LVLVCAVSALTPLSGCVIPIPTAFPQERPFVDPADEHLRLGVTTTGEIMAIFGPPHWRAENEWIYGNARLGWSLWICAYGGDCREAVERHGTDYFLRVSFDGDGVLTDYSIQSHRDLCEAQRLCIIGNLMSLPAADHLDTKSKQFSRSPDSCQIYVFPKDDLSAARVYIDDEYLGDLAAGDSFFHFSLTPGTYRVSFWSAISTERDGTSIACQAESLHYVRFRYRDVPANPTRVLLLDESRGRREVGKRWRADLDRSYEAVPAQTLRNGELLAFREGDAVSLYQYDEEGRVTSFGTNPNGEICGVLSAVVDYRLTPVGGPGLLQFMDRKGNRVQFVAVCSADGGCELPSLFGQERCRVAPVDAIEFAVPKRGVEEDLLVVEPAERRPYFNEIFFGSATEIAERATCDDRTCGLSLDALRRDLHPSRKR